jgi:hypothetical protein
LFRHRLRAVLSAIVLTIVVTAGTGRADTLSVPFPAGFVGTTGSNTGQANDIVNFATLGVSNAYFIQVSNSSSFGGTQGNDLSGTLRLLLANGQVIDIPGAINWRITQGQTLHYFGFIPAPGSTPHVITYGAGQQYTLTASSNYGLRKIGSPQAYADGADVSGNAALSGLLTQLNTYLDAVRADAPKITGPSGGEGATSTAQTVDEGQTAVTTMLADGPVTWAVFAGEDAGRFAIDPATGALTFVAAPDFEAPADVGGNNIYVVTVQATDTSGYTAQQTVTVTVADLDDTPPVISGAPSASVADGQTAVDSFTADEPVSWSLSGTDAAAFSITAAGALQFVVPPDHAAPTDQNGDNVYLVTIMATDGAGNTASMAVLVNVAAPDTDPPVISGPSGGSLALPEGEVDLIVLGTSETVTWSLGGADAAHFVIDPVTGTLTFAAAPDFEAPDDTDGDNVYAVDIIATDSAGNVGQLPLTITVTDVVEDATPPIISGPANNAVTVPEGQTATAGLTADEPVAWSIDGGADAGTFAVDADGLLTFSSPPTHATPGDADGDNVYLVNILATDDAGNASQISLAVTVTAVSAPDTTPPVVTGPSGGGGASSATGETPEGQTVVATMTANEPVSWTISGGEDAGHFVIDASGGLAFTESPVYAAPGDADSDNVYEVIVSATDGADNRTSQTLQVTVTEVLVADTTPPVVTGPSGTGPSQAVSVADGQTEVADLAADEVVVWTLTGPGAAQFTLDPATGVLSLAPGGNVGGGEAYSITIAATDSAGNATTLDLIVTVLGSVGPMDGMLDDYKGAVVEIVRDVELEHLRAGLLTLQSMTRAARDRFIAMRLQKRQCNAYLDDAPHGAGDRQDADCGAIYAMNNVPFTFDGHVQKGGGLLFATGRFFGQSGNALGTRRRLVFGELSVHDDGEGLTTSNITATVAWERSVSPRLMLGYFIGGRIAETSIYRGLSGRADKRSLSIGAYAVAELGEDLYLDGFLAFEASRNILELSDEFIQLDGRYTARSMLVGLALSGSITAPGFELRPEIAATYGLTRIGTATLVAVSDEGIEEAEVSIGRINYATLRITPELRIPLFADPGSAHFIVAPNVTCAWTGGRRDCGGGLRLGLQGTNRDRDVQFDMTVSGNWIGDTKDTTLNASIAWQF